MSPPKLKHFWWKACCDLLATKENLHKRKCQTSPLCSICSKESESIEHVLFRCDWTAVSWFGSNLNYLVDPKSIPSVMKWTISIMENFDSAKDSHESVSMCIFLAWQIWKARNGWVFNHVPVDPIETLKRAEFAWSEFYSCTNTQQVQAHDIPHSTTSAKWSPPPSGLLKANCDVAKSGNKSRAAIAVILRDHTGQVVDGRASIVHALSASHGEALAIRLAGKLLMDNQICEAIIESDNKVVIHLCSTEDVPPWEFATAIKDIRNLSFPYRFSFSWIPRSCNAAAHWVASQFLKGALSPDWMVYIPSPLSLICTSDTRLG